MSHPINANAALQAVNHLGLPTPAQATQQHNDRAPIQALDRDTTSNILARLPVRTVDAFSRAARFLQPIAREMVGRAEAALADVEQIDLTHDVQGTAVAAVRDTILSLPAAHRIVPLRLLREKIAHAIGELTNPADGEAFTAAYTRTARQVLAMPQNLIVAQLTHLLGKFGFVPPENRHQVFAAAAAGIPTAPAGLRPALCDQFISRSSRLPEEHVLPALDPLLALVVNMPAVQRAKALENLHHSMYEMRREKSREILDRVGTMIDMDSAPLAKVWCDAFAASLDYHGADQVGEWQRLNQALQQIDQLPNEAMRPHALETLLESIADGLEYCTPPGTEIAFLGSLFGTMMTRLQALDRQTRAGCLESLTKMHDRLPAGQRPQEWRRLMHQAHMLGDQQSSGLLCELSNFLGCLPAQETGRAIRQVLQASNQLPAQQRYECALSIADFLTGLRNSDPTKFYPTVDAMFEHSANLAVEHRDDYLAQLRTLFNIG